MSLAGNVTSMHAVIVDDMADSCSTLTNAADVLYRSGARKVSAVIIHPLFSANALERISACSINQIFFTNTVNIDECLLQFYNINYSQMDISDLIAESVTKILWQGFQNYGA